MFFFRAVIFSGVLISTQLLCCVIIASLHSGVSGTASSLLFKIIINTSIHIWLKGYLMIYIYLCAELELTSCCNWKENFFSLGSWRLPVDELFWYHRTYEPVLNMFFGEQYVTKTHRKQHNRVWAVWSSDGVGQGWLRVENHQIQGSGQMAFIGSLWALLLHLSSLYRLKYNTAHSNMATYKLAVQKKNGLMSVKPRRRYSFYWVPFSFVILMLNFERRKDKSNGCCEKLRVWCVTVVLMDCGRPSVTWLL